MEAQTHLLTLQVRLEVVGSENKSYAEVVAPRITWISSPRQLSLESSSTQTSLWKREMGLIQLIHVGKGGLGFP